MPGIFGYFDPANELPVDALARMACAISRDSRARTASQRIGHCGLGIVNYAGRSLIQAMDGVHFVFFGEFDSEAPDLRTRQAALELREQLFDAPEEALDHAAGFVGIRISREGRCITVVNDAFGRHPLYWARTGQAWIFASQIKCLLSALPGLGVVSRTAVATMLSIGETVGNHTLIEDIHTFPAASRLRLSGHDGAADHGQTGQIVRYWHYQYVEDHARSWSDSVDEAGTALRRSVAQCLTGFESPAVPLSGGLDSRFILDLAVQGGSKATAYTWGVEGCRDLTYASSVAHKLGCSHQSYFFDPAYLAKQAERGVWLTEGQTPATNFHVLPYLDLLAENRHDLILDGFAGDAVLGGNFITPDWYQEPDVSIAAEGLWQWRRSSFDNGWNSPALDNMRSTARELFTATYMRASGRTPMDKAMAFLIDNRVRRTTVCGSELFRSRIHVRQPFMSPKFMESISHLPHTWRKRHRFYVDVMRRYAPSSAAAPYQRTMLPASAPYWQSWLALALQRTYSMAGKRLPFLPPMSGKSPSDFPAWLRGPLRPYVENVLLSERTLDRAIVPPDVTKLVVSTHMAGGSDFSALIGAMISIELFCRLFVDDLASSVRQFSECGGNISPGNGQ